MPEPATLVPEQLATQSPVSTSVSPEVQDKQTPESKSIDAQSLYLQTYWPLFKAFGVYPELQDKQFIAGFKFSVYVQEVHSGSLVEQAIQVPS